MRNLFLAMLAAAGASILTPHQAAAQYYYLPFLNAGQNPGGLNTDSEDNAANGLPGWTNILTGTAAIGVTPVWTPVQQLPFGFQFNGQAFTSFKMSSTGVLTFDVNATTVPAANNVALPSASIPNNSVCVWGVKMTGSNDYLVTKTFGTAPNRQFWIQMNSVTEAGTGGYVYWSIVLEEGTNNVYMVDQRTSTATTLTVGVQIDGATAIQVTDSPNVDRMNQNLTTVADNSYYGFFPGAQPGYDLTLRSLDLPRYVGRANGRTQFSGELLNQGSQMVTSYDLNYSINGGTPVTIPISGVAIQSMDTDVFGTLGNAGWQPTANGNYTVRVWTSNVNGNPDQVPANDTIIRQVRVVDSVVTRKVVEESFTSSTCNPCNPGNANVRAVNRQNPGKYVRIAYQQNFPRPASGVTDPYYTAEGGARFRYYNGSYVPYLLLDGSWGDISTYLTSDILNSYYSVPGLLMINADYSVSGQTVTATARIKSFDNFPANRLVAHMVITERTTRNNALTNGETEFHDVMKKMMPNANGTPLSALTSGQTVTLNQTYTFPAGNTVESFDSLQVVFFVQDVNTKEIFNGTVGTRLRPTGLAADASVNAFTVVPNPAADGNANLHLSLRTGQPVTVEVLDALGRVVLTRPTETLGAGEHRLPLNLTSAPHGLYVVRVRTASATLTERLVVE